MIGKLLIKGWNSLPDLNSSFRFAGHVDIHFENAKQFLRREFQHVNLRKASFCEEVIQIMLQKEIPISGPPDGSGSGSGSSSEGPTLPIFIVGGALVLFGTIACFVLRCYLKNRIAKMEQQNLEHESPTKSFHTDGHNNNPSTIINLKQDGNVPTMPPQQQEGDAPNDSNQSVQGYSIVPHAPPAGNIPSQQHQPYAQHQQYNPSGHNPAASTTRNNDAMPSPQVSSQSGANLRVPASPNVSQTSVKRGVPPTTPQWNIYESKVVSHGVPLFQQHQKGSDFPSVPLLQQYQKDSNVPPEHGVQPVAPPENVQAN